MVWKTSSFRRRSCFALAAALAVATPAWAGERGDPRSIPLVDQRGVAFRLEDLKGKPTVLTFVATRCTAVCPIASAAFARLSRRLQADRVPANVVAVTLDPGYDTPFVMAKYAQNFGDRDTGWRLASGRPDDVRALIRSFGVVTRNGPDLVPDEHSSFVYVLNRDVRLTRTLLLSDHLATDVEPAVRAIEKPSGS